MHLNAIGGDCPGKTELHRDVVSAASVFVEYPPQTRIEGEIQQFGDDFPGHRTLAGPRRPAHAAARSRDEVTLFDSVGFAIEDFSTLRFVRDLTRTDRRDIDLVPDLADPKDLFSLLAPSVTTTEVRTPLHA